MKICRDCGRKESSKVVFQPKRAECSRCRRKAERKPPIELPESVVGTDLPEAGTYVVTWAQNATPVNRKFLKALLVYCARNNAKLVVIPGRYRNPTAITLAADVGHDEWWAQELAPYLFGSRAAVGRVTIYGDIPIQPTAVRPLTGMEVFAGSNSAIFGHPKLQLQTVATAKRRYPRIFTTTGAVTKPNYTRSKAGKKGEAHHIYGAVIIEQDGELFHLRQINALKDGTFIDLNTKYTPDGAEAAPRALGLVCGDIHVARPDESVLRATFEGPDSIVAVLQPEKIVYHDLLDFDARNHHRIHYFPDRYERAAGRRNDDVAIEIDDAIDFIDNITPQNSSPIVVISNHDEAFDRWLNTADPKLDPVNAKFFHATWTALLDHFDDTGEFLPALELLYNAKGRGRAAFVKREDVLKIGGIYCNFHGDIGINGSRGTIDTFAKLGVKTITGHGHSPGILDGAYRVGVTGQLEMGYNLPPSSWLNSHCVIYANGKRALISVVGGRWHCQRRSRRSNQDGRS